MSHTRETVERYRIIARAGCRVAALLCLVMGAWHYASILLLYLGNVFLGWSGWMTPSDFLNNPRSAGSLMWLLLSACLWRFDQRLARWIVPDPPTLGKHACPKCGYSLKGLGDRPICPECGADVRPPSSSPSTP